MKSQTVVVTKVATSKSGTYNTLVFPYYIVSISVYLYLYLYLYTYTYILILIYLYLYFLKMLAGSYL